MAGLALRYFIDETESQDYSSLGLFLSGDDFFIDDIPFRTVTDTVLNSSRLYKRTSLQFEDLSPEQTAKLDYFLLNHTLGEA